MLFLTAISSRLGASEILFKQALMETCFGNCFLKGYISINIPMSHCYILFKAVSAEWAILIQSRISGRLAEKNGSFKNNLVIHGNKHCRRKYYSAWRQNVAH